MKNIFLIFFLLFLHLQSYSQHISHYLANKYPESDTSFDYNSSLNQILISSHLTTGALWDKASPNVDLNKFESGNETTYLITKDELHSVYFDVRNSLVNTVSLPTYDSLLKLVDRVGLEELAMPLVILDFDLQRIDSNAFSNGTLEYVNGEVQVVGLNNPFIQFNIFGASTGNNISFIPGEMLNLRLDDRFIFSNTNKQIYSVELKIGEGEWIMLEMNSNFNISTESNEKSLDLEIRTTFMDESISTSRWRLISAINNCNPPVSEYAPWASEALVPGGITIEHLMRATTSIDAVAPFAGKVYVKYRNSLSPNAPRTFLKPIILVEGLDLGDINLAQIKFTNQLGSFGWPQLWNCNPEEFPTQDMPGFLNELITNDYDIIFLDFFDGSGRIENNGLLLQELISRVNQYRIGNNEIVLWGVSMGGQIARWALLNMEANNLSHCSRLFISHDSPWKGAVLPASAFHLLLSQANESAKAAKNVEKLNKFAPKQLLVHHINFSSPVTIQNRSKTINYTASTMASAEHYAFFNAVNALGSYPRNTRNVALSNGNIYGNLKFNAGATMLDIDACVKLQMYSEAATDNKLLTLKKGLNRSYSWFATGLPNFSGAPGGTRKDIIRDTRDDVRDQVPNWCKNNIPPAVHEKFSFIPTISALNLNTVDIFLNVSGAVNRDNPHETGLTEFASIYGPSTDELHGDVNSLNIAWLKRQIFLGENKVNTFNAQLASLWNNPTENKYLRGFVINNGGHFKINGVGNVYNLTQSASLMNPLKSHSDVRLGSPCSGSVITMNNGSTMTIGEVVNVIEGTFNSATLTIGANSVLEIKAGSTLSITNLSNIIVEQGGTLKVAGNLVCKPNTKIEVRPGGTLIYEGNVPIQLEDYNSVLIIKGTLQLGVGAEFRTVGNGYIHWKSENPGQMPVIVAQQPAKIKLQGSSPTQILSIIDENIVLVIPSTVDFELAHGKVLNRQNSELLIRGKCNMLNARLGGQSGQIAKGIKLLSSKICDIKFSHFEYSVIGLEINQTLNTNHAHLVGNHFKNNQTSGLFIHDKGALIGDCKFINNAVGLTLSAVSSVVNTYLGVFQNNSAYGVYAHSTSFQPLLISGCSFTGANTGTAMYCVNGNLNASSNVISGHLYGLVMEAGAARASCNNISGAIFGIEILPTASLNISNSARNLISNNEVGIYLHNSFIDFTNGKNNLSNNYVRSLQGIMQPLGLNRISLPFLAGFYDFRELPTSENLFNTPLMYPATSPGLINTDYDVETYYHDFYIDPLTNYPMVFNVNYSLLEPVFYVNNQPNFNFQTCSQVTVPWYEEVYPEIASTSAPSSFVLYSTLHNAIELKDAIRNALSFVTLNNEDVKNDLLALSLLNDVLIYNYGLSSTGLKEILTIAREAMAFTLSNAYSQGILPMHYGTEPEPLSAYSLAILGNLSERISENQGNPDEIARLTVEKALVYRLTGHYEIGLDLMASQEAINHPQRDYWVCVLQNEWDLLRDIIAIDQFNLNVANCANMYAFRKMKPTVRQKNNYEKTDKSADKLLIYPNPTSTLSKVIVPRTDKICKLQITNQQGAMVKEYTITAGATEFILNSSDFVGGVYSILLMSENEVMKATKWIVIK